MHRCLHLIGRYIVVFFLWSCDQNFSTLERFEKEDTVLVAVDAEPPEGFNPVLGWGRYGYPYFHSTVLKRDAQHRILPDLAEWARLSNDGLVWNIKIRTDAVFSDGITVTAYDVAYTFRLAAQAAGKIDLSAMESVTVQNKTHLKIRLKTPQITFVHRLTTLGIVPRHAYGADYGRRPIGSGPYRMVRWDEGRQMIMEGNPFYYGKKPSIHRVIFLYLNEESAVAAAKANRVHVVKVPQVLSKMTIYGMRLVAVRSIDNRGICFPTVPYTANKDMNGYPIGNNVTSDISIRKAVNLAVRREALVQGILEGHGTPAFGPVSHLPWEQNEAGFQDANPVAAKSTLSRAGWKDSDGDGVLEKGQTEARFTLLYPSEDLVRQALSLAVADGLREIGISVKVVGKSWDEIYRLMHTHPVMFGFGSLDQTEMHNLFHSNPGSLFANNAGMYHNPQVDFYLDQAMHSKTESDAVGFWKLAQWDGTTGFSFRGDAPWAWLVNLNHTYYVSEKIDLGNLYIEQHGSSITANIVDWKWKENP